MRYLRKICCALMVVLVGIMLLGAAEQHDACLYVVNALSNDLSVINTASGAVTQIPLGARGYQLAFAPQHTYALVTAAAQMVVAPPAGAGSTAAFSGLLVVDLAQQHVCGTIPLALSPLAQVHIRPDGKQAVVVTAAGPGNRNLVRGQVVFVDLEHSTVTGTSNIGLNPLDSVMTPDGAKLYTADWGSKSISIIDLTTGRLFDSIPLGANPARVLALSPNGDTVFAGLEFAHAARAESGNAQMNSQQSQVMTPVSGVDDPLLWSVNTQSGAVSKYFIPGLQKVMALTVSPDGQRLYLYGRMGRSDNSTIQHGQLAPLGTKNSVNNIHPQMPQQLTLSGGQQSAPTDANDLLVFDVAAGRVVNHFGNFGGLASVTVSPDGQRLYLIGTHGDPAQEAALRAKITQRQAQRSIVAPMNNVKTLGNNSTFSNYNTANAEIVTSPSGNADISDIMNALSRIHKTVTVLDATSGRQLAIYTVGSLPQGSAWLY